MICLSTIREELIVTVAILSLGAVMSCSDYKSGAQSANDTSQTFNSLIERRHRNVGLNVREFAGRSVFTKYCQVCHGAEGDGKGFNAFNLQNSFGVQPANFSDTSFAVKHSDESLVAVISKGGKTVGKSQYMPPWGSTLSGEEIDDVVAYIRTFSRIKREDV